MGGYHSTPEGSTTTTTPITTDDDSITSGRCDKNVEAISQELEEEEEDGDVVLVGEPIVLEKGFMDYFGLNTKGKQQHNDEEQKNGTPESSTVDVEWDVNTLRTLKDKDSNDTDYLEGPPVPLFHFPKRSYDEEEEDEGSPATSNSQAPMTRSPRFQASSSQDDESDTIMEKELKLLRQLHEKENSGAKSHLQRLTEKFPP